MKTDFLKRARVQYINNPALQIRYGLMLCAFGLACFATMAFLSYLAIYRIAENGLSAEAKAEVLEKILKPSQIFGKAEVIIPIVILSIFIFCLGVLATQRFAGPIFAMKRHLDGLQTGRRFGIVRLRSTDELQELVEPLNSLLKFWFDRDETIEAMLLEAITRAERGETSRVIDGIQEVRSILAHSPRAAPPNTTT